MKRLVRPALTGLSLLPLLAALAVAAPQKPTAPKASGYAPVETILKAKCVGCHQGAKAAAGVNLSSYADVTKAKFKGKAVVVPKKAKDSVISKAVHGTGVQKMPPGGSLSSDEIKAIDAWIAAGAKK